ncbi:hypothetical protein FNV43_RR07811 [Rhamnella rubrinervis]|uniref:Uncharacterized protein n=1 Tax=Rhamnella rubrinervis TaxID=2594499 RepID=A0A8K0MNC6_9ROSA|nr:hypothetical protein FNV43_RR07811 [Rhamnella rubrinervis]
MAVLVHYLLPSCCSLTPRNGIQRACPGSGTQRFGVVQCLAKQQTSNIQDANRQLANFKPSSWSYDYLQSLKEYYTHEAFEDRAKELRKEVKSMISNEKTEFLTTLELIDDIERLGLAYHFEEEIQRALSKCVSLVSNNQTLTETSLHATALRFRLFRQHGYEVSQDIFRSFMDQNGSFKESISEDAKGMLSLHEASHLGYEGEEVVDEAKAFTTKHLKVLRGDSSTINSYLSQRVNHALEIPLHHRIQRLETWWFIGAYSKRSDANQLLLDAAKLDFNLAQSTHKSDLKDLARWWKGLGLAKKLSFSRDRLMESFFWALGMVNGTQYSKQRKGITKAFYLVTVIDDVYDVYGTLDELELFTNTVERWDVVSAVNNLPDYMKLCFLALYNAVNETAYDALKDHGHNNLLYLTKAWADLCKAFLVEAKWSKSKYSPTLEQYLENAWISVSGVVLLASYFVLSDNITKQGLESLQSHHNLLRWPCIIFRLTNDLATSTAEIQRGETTNSISCSMRQYGHSEECARKYLRDMIDETWKKLNKEIADHHDDGDSPFPKHFLDTTVNLARISECQYQYGDGHGDPDQRSEERVLSLIIHPIE